MSHPFDNLKYDTIWETELYFDIFDANARLSLYAEEEGPEEWQKILFDNFYKAQNELKPKIYNAIYKYYQEVAHEYRNMLGSEALKFAPEVNDINGLRKLLTPDSVFIADVFPEKEEIGILFECTWEDEHGLGVRIEDGNIVEVGFQDVCL